jgi:hypothetical protein
VDVGCACARFLGGEKKMIIDNRVDGRRQAGVHAGRVPGAVRCSWLWSPVATTIHRCDNVLFLLTFF